MTSHTVCNRTQSRGTSRGAACPEQDSSDKPLFVGTEADSALVGEWGRLMAAAQVGDIKAYRILLSEVTVRLRRYYAGRLPPAMCEDAIQDILLAIHDKRHTYDHTRSFGPWLTAIVQYKWIDRCRSLKSEAATPPGEDIRIPEYGDSGIAGAAFQELISELKPPQAGAVRPAKPEKKGLGRFSRVTGHLPSRVRVNFHGGLKWLANIIKDTSDAV